MKKKYLFICLIIYLIGCVSNSTTIFNITMPTMETNDYVLNDKHKMFSDILCAQNKIMDMPVTKRIALELGDDIEHYGNWYEYYHVPTDKNADYILIIRTDDTSMREYMIFYDGCGMITSSYVVAEIYGDGADFKHTYSSYKNKCLNRTIMLGSYIVDNDTDIIIDTLPPIVDTLIEKIYIR